MKNVFAKKEMGKIQCMLRTQSPFSLVDTRFSQKKNFKI